MAGKKTPPTPEDYEMKRLYEEALMSITDLAKLYSFSTSGCHCRLIKVGTKFRRPGVPSGKLFSPERNMQVIQLYLDGKSSSDIAEIIGVDRSEILRRLRRAGVTRTNSEARKNLYKHKPETHPSTRRALRERAAKA